MSTEPQPTRRRDIETALDAMKAVQMELQDGLTPKGYVAHSYLEEKLGYFQDAMDRIMKSSGAVEPPREKVKG